MRSECSLISDFPSPAIAKLNHAWKMSTLTCRSIGLTSNTEIKTPVVAFYAAENGVRLCSHSLSSSPKLAELADFTKEAVTAATKVQISLPTLCTTEDAFTSLSRAYIPCDRT